MSLRRNPCPTTVVLGFIRFATGAGRSLKLVDEVFPWLLVKPTNKIRGFTISGASTWPLTRVPSHCNCGKIGPLSA